MTQPPQPTGKFVYIYGPPGCGKTTTAARRIKATAAARGPDKVMICSFTKAAALEIAGRDEVAGGSMPIPEEMIGTLHSHALRAIGRPPLYVTAASDWNKRHPQWTVSGHGQTEDAPADWAGAGEGMKLLGECDIFRAQMIPPSAWRQELQFFWEAWVEWKAEAGVLDFTEMIERALAETTHAPGNPEVIFVDEAQDQVPLEHALLQKWGEAAERVIVFSDDDQCQPPWTSVLTDDHGWVAMENLDPKVHLIVSVDLDRGEVTGGFPFEVAARTGVFPRVEVRAGGLSTSATLDHLWWVRRGGSVVRVRSRDLLASDMVPIASPDRGVSWVPIETTLIPGTLGTVYSLSVEPHKTYITDGGIVTGNCLYRFRGADASSLIGVAKNPEDKIVLSQSYRVPAEVLEFSQRWVGRLSAREPKEYQPRTLNPDKPLWSERGSVKRLDRGIDAATELVTEIEARLEVGHTVMVLAACGYMLNPLKEALRSTGVPFWNPYRPTRGDWNPLGNRNAKTLSASARLLAYLRPSEEVFGDQAALWTGGDVKAFTKYLRSSGILRRGAKQAIAALPDRELDFEEVAPLFASDEVLERAAEPDPWWYRENLTSEGAKALEFPLKVLERYGPRALIEPPRLIIGTIHSSKGGQSDCVFLAPDLSYAGTREWLSGDPLSQDAIIRQMYVGVTRAAEELVILAPAANAPGSAPLVEDL